MGKRRGLCAQPTACEPEEVHGPVYVTIAMRRPSANSDLDNRLKGIGDLLQEIGAIANDKHIMGWNAFWFELPPGIAAEISIVDAERVAA